MNRTPDPEWNVYIDNVNSKQIQIFNVFHSMNFLKGCKNEFKRYQKHKDIELLEKEIKSWAMYAFWSKCEYEIVLSPWVSKSAPRKIDVYDQLMLNWDSFFKYTFEHKAYFLRRE